MSTTIDGRRPDSSFAESREQIWSIHIRHYLLRWRDEAALAADVLVTYFTIDIELFRVLAQRRQLGRPSLCEINDYFPDVAPWNPVHASWSPPRRQQYLRNLMARGSGQKFKRCCGA